MVEIRVAIRNNLKALDIHPNIPQDEFRKLLGVYPETSHAKAG